MDIKKLKEEYIGKKLLNIIDIDLNDDVVISALRKITGETGDWGGVDSAKILLFENNKALVFVDFDCDGYRSGEWYLIHLKNLLDKNQTKGIKVINSVVKDIEYFKEGAKIPADYSSSECILITTDEYVIRMGQDNSDSYYPSNFFDLKECKKVALGIKFEGEVVERENE